MYLSRIPLNPARRGTRTLLSSPQATHAAVLAAFPPEAYEQPVGQGRVLWRIDQSANTVHLYVVSPCEPDFTHVVEQAGWPTTTAWTTRKYTQLLDTLTIDQRWHFRLTANPVRGIISPEANAAKAKVRGKVTGLSATEQLDWLRRKADQCGFTFSSCGPAGQREDDLAVVGRGTIRFRRGSAQVTLSHATYEGTLVVTDPHRLRGVLIEGIGRAKGYGCGLLTLAPAR